MEDNSYFQAALHKMTSEFAYADAIIHLHKRGLTPEQIEKQLLYPVSIRNIEKVIADYEKNLRTEGCYEYVRDTDAYGRTSFRRVRRD